jgi:hypothetical protein
VRPMDTEKFIEAWNRIDTSHHNVKVHIGRNLGREDYIGYLIANRYKIHKHNYYGYEVVSFYNDRNQGYWFYKPRVKEGHGITFYNDKNQEYDTFIADIALADISSIEKV